MRKLKMNVEEIRVDTFEPEKPSEGRGTVQGHIPPTPQTACPECPTKRWDEWTCEYTCGSCFTVPCGGGAGCA